MPLGPAPVAMAVPGELPAMVMGVTVLDWLLAT